jgi:carbon-monoxide dehydrogenase large subunit
VVSTLVRGGAAAALVAPAALLLLRPGWLVVADTGSETDLNTIGKALGYAKDGVSPLDTLFEGAQQRSFPTGAHVAEVQVDPQTGEVELLSYVGVDDCGNIINHTLAEGQVHGGIMQGLGQVFGEVCVYDQSGQMLSGSFMDYCMPRAGDLTTMRCASLRAAHVAPGIGCC